MASLGAIIGAIIGGLASCIVTALINTPILKLACWIVTRFSPPLKMAFKASFLGTLMVTLVFASGVLGVVFMGASNLNSDYMLVASILIIAIIAIGFLIQTIIYGKVLKPSEGTSIGFLKALLANIIVYVVYIVILGGISLTSMFLQ
jgi:hypothetical protein